MKIESNTKYYENGNVEYEDVLTDASMGLIQRTSYLECGRKDYTCFFVSGRFHGLYQDWNWYTNERKKISTYYGFDNPWNGVLNGVHIFFNH